MSTENWSSWTTNWSSWTTGGSTSKGFTIDRSPVTGWRDGLQSTSRQPVTVEQTVREFETPRILALRARRKALEEADDDSETIWGRATNAFSSPDVDSTTDKLQYYIVSSPSNQQQPNKKNTRIYTEYSRTNQVVRVINPEDEDQYVDVERVVSITFTAPDGNFVRFDLKPPAGTPVPK